jgi:D-threo-aldose 1-dehydrogenase
MVSLGAGPVSGLFTSDDAGHRQLAVVERALQHGINWIDTAATYGDGRSETALGLALAKLNAASRASLATKVRIPEKCPADLKGFVEHSLEQSLFRLGVPRVALLQLHNSITARPGDQPTSITPEQVLGAGGVLEGLRSLARRGLVEHFGLTGLGDLPSLARVAASRAFAAMQAPFNVLEADFAKNVPEAPHDPAPGRRLIEMCVENNMGFFAIRVLAGGALAGRSPSRHTLTTPFFPLSRYQCEQRAAASLAQRLEDGMTLPEVAIRYATHHTGVSSAIIGFATPAEVDQAAAFAARGPLPPRYR